MIRTLALAALSAAAALPAGPFPLTLPLEGLTEENRDGVRRALERGLKGLETEDGDRILMEITRLQDGELSLVLDCRGGLTLGHLVKALEGSGVSVDPSRWILHGRAAFTWTLPDPGTAAGRDAARKALEGFGLCEVLDASSKDGKRHDRTAHLVFFDEKKGDLEVPYRDLLAAVKGLGAKDPDLMWYTHPVKGVWALPCGARRSREKN